MTKTEPSFVAKKREGDPLGRGEKKFCRRPTKHGAPKMSIVVQQLFAACREGFKGPGTVPRPPDVDKLQHILDKMKPEDVGLREDLPFFKSNDKLEGTPRITSTTIYKSENFSMCIFFLPPNGVIPLHNHPGMTVVSKLLVGKMHIKAYDWVDPSQSDDMAPSSPPRLARLVVDSVFTAPCDTSVLYPTTGGNLHAFTALTPCAVLDVMGPPYSKEDDRDCTYYSEFPFSGVKEDDCSYRLLKAIEMPKDLKMDVVEYLGPQVVEC